MIHQEKKNEKKRALAVTNCDSLDSRGLHNELEQSETSKPDGELFAEIARRDQFLNCEV